MNDSSENYLKSILILQRKKGSVRSVDIADEMGVTRPSVSNAMKKLRRQELIYFDDVGCICFTATGRTMAENIYKKHRLITRALRRIGVSSDTADREACLIEHAISEETYECIDRFMSR